MAWRLWAQKFASSHSSMTPMLQIVSFITLSVACLFTRLYNEQRDFHGWHVCGWASW
jgi:hypothetical protein